MSAWRRRLFAVFTSIGSILLGLTWVAAGPADALPAPPIPCGFTFGAQSSQGAAGTQTLQVNIVPANPAQSCITTQTLTDQITNASGQVPSGITIDGGAASVVVLFAPSELPPPSIEVGWHGYCTAVPQPVFFHLSGAGQNAVYPLGTSRPCSQGPGPTSFLDPPRVLTPDPIVGLAAAAGGYRLAAVDGSVLGQPGAVIEAGDFSSAPFVGIASDPSGTGFWLVSSTGGVYSFGGAAFYGSAGSLRLSQPIVGMAATSTGHGYWLVAADGGVFSFGDAHFYGSTGGVHLAAPIVGMAATSDGGGYWLAAADGGVFAFGDARFHGSAGAVPLNAPIVGVAADHVTGGYWLVASDGGVFSYGATFHGSAGGAHLAAPITGITSTTDSGGYWLVGADGGVFTYGDAPFHGSGSQLVGP